MSEGHGGSPRVSRRALLGAAFAGTAGAAAGGFAAGSLLGAQAGAESSGEVDYGADVIDFYGVHQAGVTAPHQAHETLLAFDLKSGSDRDALRRMMRLATDDAARLTAGRAPLADLEAELAVTPARLTITFGFGPGFVAAAGGTAPSWLQPLPAFGVDRLDPVLSGGDLFVSIASDAPLTVAHAERMMHREIREFADLRWTQRGFRTARGTEPDGQTMRNLFGQVDGTAGPNPGDDDFDETVWVSDGWMAGGTSLVLRRIAMDLDGWDEIGRADRETSIGRRLSDGAPITGGVESDPVDLEAVDELGLEVVPAWAHVRRARSAGTRIYRRGANYAELPQAPDDTGVGLLFMAFQADPVAQFVPMQHALDELDLLNTWTTPVGSAVFAIPPGCEPGGYIGETLLE